MEKTNLQKWMDHASEELCEMIGEREGMLTDREYTGLELYLGNLKEVLDWCRTIREAERIKKMLKE